MNRDEYGLIKAVNDMAEAREKREARYAAIEVALHLLLATLEHHPAPGLEKAVQYAKQALQPDGADTTDV